MWRCRTARWFRIRLESLLGPGSLLHAALDRDRKTRLAEEQAAEEELERMEAT